MRCIFGLLVCCSLLACQSTVVDAKNTANAPESVGFSSERLDRIAPAMQRYIDQGKLAGTLTPIRRVLCSRYF